MDKKEFTDMYLIAALLAYGFDLVASDKENPNRQKFSFSNSECLIYIKDMNGEIQRQYSTLDEMETLFLSKRLLLPGSYPDILKGLKQDILSHRRYAN